MHRARLLIVVLVGMFVAGALPAVVWAEENPAGAFLVEEGERYYRQGDLENAMHEFSKALIVDPHNKKAHGYLTRHGLEGGLYNRPVTSESQLVEMAGHVNEYKNQVNGLEQEKSAIKQQLSSTLNQNDALKQSRIAKELELNLIQEKLNLVEKVMHGQDADFKQKMQEIEKEYEQKLNDLNQELSQAKDSPKPVVAMKDVNLAQKEKAIKELKEELQGDFHANMDYERKLKGLIAKNEELKEYSQDVYVYHQKIIRVLEDYLRLREDSVNDYQDDVVYKHADLTSTQSDLFNSLDEMVKVHVTLQDYLTRLSEREEQVNQKEEDVDALRIKLAEAQKRILELTSAQGADSKN